MRGQPRNHTHPIVRSPPQLALVHTAAANAPAPPLQFSWRQIESTDYRTYVANLRAIDCPEQTIADIIRADVHGLYLQKRKGFGMDQQFSSGPWSTREEKRVVASLLGPDAEPPGATSELTDSRAVLPLVLRAVDPARLQLDPQQEAALAELRADFIAELGGRNQDPADPGYAQRWNRLQPQSDQLVRGMIGVNAFMRYQNETQ